MLYHGSRRNFFGGNFYKERWHVKLLYAGPVVNTEMLVVMLDKHGIVATQEFEDPALPDDGDLSRPARVLVDETDYDRAYRLFFTEREDEL